MMTYTIRTDPHGRPDKRYVVDGLQRPDGFADVDAALAAALAEAEQASRQDQRVTVQQEDADGQIRVLHRYGPR